MKRELFQLYKIGRELGLAKKEIDKVFLYDNFKDKYLGGFILIIIIIFIGFSIILASLFAAPNSPYIPPSNNTYQTGTLYSTVRIKDFKKRK